MLLRRLVALFSAVTMFHLSVGAADAACAGNDATGHHSAAAHGMADRPLGHEHHADASIAGTQRSASPHAVRRAVAAPPESSAPGRSPAQLRCCESMTSCSVTGAVSQRVSVVATLPGASPMSPARTDSVSSVPQAPEPPPPKA